MEENNVELIDYLIVIWKRKILIIVVTLVGIGVGVGVGVVGSKEKSELPVYRADAVVKIGKKVRLVPTSGISAAVDYIENPGNLVESIPLEYDFIIKELPEYYLKVEQIGPLAMLRIILKGQDRGVERVLKKLVDMLIDEHRQKAQDSVIAYKTFMKRLEINTEELEKEIVAIDSIIKEMKKKEGEYLMHVESSTREEKTKGDRSAFLNMLYLKIIDRESSLNAKQSSLRNIQMQIVKHQITVGNLEEYKTELVGKIKSTTIVGLQKKDKRNDIVVAGIAGLIMSLFIAFFMEYIEGAKSRRKGQGQG